VEKKGPNSFQVIVPGRIYELETVPEGPSLDYWISGFDSWRIYLLHQVSPAKKQASSTRLPPVRPNIQTLDVQSTYHEPKSAETKIPVEEDHSQSYQELKTFSSTRTDDEINLPSEDQEDLPKFSTLPQAPVVIEPSRHQQRKSMQITATGIPDRTDTKPFWNSIKENDSHSLSNTLKTDRIDPGSTFRSSPLHVAIEAGAIDVIKLLLRNKVNPNTLDSLGQSPLLYAIEKQSGLTSSTIVDLLLVAGADIHEGDTSENKFSPLHAACLAGNDHIVSALFRRGADPKAEDNRMKWTALHWAAVGGSLGICTQLISKGVQMKSVRGVSPVDLAQDFEHKSLVKYLSHQAKA